MPDMTRSQNVSGTGCPQDPPLVSPHPVVLRDVREGAAIATVEMMGMAPAEHTACYRRALNDLLDVRVTSDCPEAVLHGFYIGEIHVSHGRHSPRTVRRTQKTASRDGFDGIALQLTQEGYWQGRTRDRSLSGEPGAVALFDFRQSFTLSDIGDRSFVNVLIPRASARRTIEDPASLHGSLAVGAKGAALAGFLDGLIAHAPAVRAAHTSALSNVLMELVALTFDASDDGRLVEQKSPDRRLMDRVERLIGQRLSARDLTPEWIADKLGVSRSQLYSASPSGGIVRLIWDRRLAAVHAALIDPSEQRTIATLSGLFGFASNAHFSRAYTKRYGVSPSAARKAALRTTD
ncbi:helix-turn-helix domain-containing protein [uncultured Sphingomonas sp.]|uniref:helix-turn-helix domain-containing protein n=1 Tax=uncultured Sphingomonas sp. TaxID=158754 RepID=UPI0030F99E52